MPLKSDHQPITTQKDSRSIRDMLADPESEEITFEAPRLGNEPPRPQEFDSEL